MATPFVPPLILEATSRPRAARWRDAVLTLLLWAGWLYLMLAAVGALWTPPFVQHLLPVEPPDRPWTVIRIALINVAIAAVLCTVMLLRVVWERRRFAGDDRRTGFALPAEADIAEALSVPAADIPAWRSARRLVVHHDADGRVTRAELGG